MEPNCVCPLVGTEKECTIDGALCSTRSPTTIVSRDDIVNAFAVASGADPTDEQVRDIELFVGLHYSGIDKILTQAVEVQLQRA